MSLTLKNMMEILVREKLAETIDNYGCCKCDKCQMDILSYALNQLPPRYVATPIGGVFAKAEQLSIQHGADVLSAIARGVAIVESRPRHDVKNIAEEDVPIE